MDSAGISEYCEGFRGVDYPVFARLGPTAVIEVGGKFPGLSSVHLFIEIVTDEFKSDVARRPLTSESEHGKPLAPVPIQIAITTLRRFATVMCQALQWRGIK